ncbi:probable transcription repressor OFP9 [Prosopis cineraria]|uniref:probable transcription repressor OFP9 n=1 Tax=Prosopis cineraria TaxID=364024 RepID=UPI00240F80D8|nr:probable transcription repressor OFP9 [Prosopis cineraria]
MKPSRQQRVCKALCCSCNCRLSVSSSSEELAESSSSADRFPSVSSLAHAMVQERLDQMIRDQREKHVMVERSTRLHQHHHHHTSHIHSNPLTLEHSNNHHQYQYQRQQKTREEEGTKFVVMVAMEKSSYDPREDFRESMVEMITANRLQDAKELRSLLNYYVSMNSQEYHSLILEVFHEVCTNLFFIM